MLFDGREGKAVPLVSIVIPARNEGRFIGLCLDSAKSCMAGAVSFETIVVDNHSTDGTIDVAIHHGADVVLSHGGTIAFGRNAGMAVARSKILIFLDADVVLTPEWRAQFLLLKEISGRQFGLIGAPYNVRPGGAWIEQCWFEKLARGNPSYLSGGHIISSKSTMAELGGFDHTLPTGEDVDLCARARELGVPVVVDRNLKVLHLGYPRTVRQFFSREMWHGVGDVQNLERLLSSRVAMLAILSVVLSLLVVAVSMSAEKSCRFGCHPRTYCCLRNCAGDP